MPGLDETFEYLIPEGHAERHRILRARQGHQNADGNGNMYITVNVEVPSRLTREQKQALESFDQSVDPRQTAKMRAYRDNVQALYGVDPYKK